MKRADTSIDLSSQTGICVYMYRVVLAIPLFVSRKGDRYHAIYPVVTDPLSYIYITLLQLFRVLKTSNQVLGRNLIFHKTARESYYEKIRLHSFESAYYYYFI